MPIKLLLCCFLALPTLAIADAAQGEFMGYELGARYPASTSNAEVTTTGSLVITAQNPVKPTDIAEVSLIATPESRTIGGIVAVGWYATETEARAVARRYVELLRAKYPDWTLGREVMDAGSRIVEVNLDKAPHTLQLRLVPDERDGRSMWRFSMSLGWGTDSNEWRIWQATAASEHASSEANERARLLKDADIRGL